MRSGRHVELVNTMGTVVTLEVRSEARPAGLDRAFAEARQRLHDIDALFSTWQPGSWASRLLRQEVTVEDCPADVRSVHRLARALEELTGGCFSTTWRVSQQFGSVERGPDAVGLVKGWAAQQASDVLVTHGLPDHLVNAAGDVVVSGSPRPGRPDSWRVGISNPHSAGDLVGAVTLAPGRHRWSVATSGPAERGLHVVDPHGGRLPDAVASATAVVRVSSEHPEAGAVADACATALVAAGRRAGSLAERLEGCHIHALRVLADGGISDPGRLLIP